MLQEKLAIITGASRGIGFAIAELFAKNGCRLILCGRNEDVLRERSEYLNKQYNVESHSVSFDISEYQDIKEKFREIYKISKRADILVNNAGILDDALIGMISEESMDRTLSTNLKGAIHTMQYASKMMKGDRGGSIINVSSIIGRVGNEGQVVYGASKAGLIGASLSAAKELAPRNIRVNVIAPGFIETDMVKAIPEDIFKERIESIKMKRIGTPEDIAGTALYLASPLSSYVTGQIIGVDGGMLI